MPRRVRADNGRGYTFKDRTGQRNGRLVFLRALPRNKHLHTVWEARCDCGVVTTTSQPKKVRSCGCLQREAAARTQRNKALDPDAKAASRKLAAKRQRDRRRLSPVAVMQARLSRLHRHALAQVGAIKTSPTFEQLGYTPEEFVAHIERQFVDGLGWHNMPLWQIDHIVPAKEAKNEADVVALNQLSNLRPMWAKENNAKKARRLTLL